MICFLLQYKSAFSVYLFKVKFLFVYLWLGNISCSYDREVSFTTPIGRKDEADLAKSALAMADSDHLTIYNAYLG